MSEQTIALSLSIQGLNDNANSQLRQEYQAYQSLLQAQPITVQQHLRDQTVRLTETIVKGNSQIRYSLPETICLPSPNKGEQTMSLPSNLRNRNLGGFLTRIIHSSLLAALNAQISELEHSVDPAVALCADLMRHALVVYMVHDYLPQGKSVQYRADDIDDIPCHPVDRQSEPDSSSEWKSFPTISYRDSSDEWQKGLDIPCQDAATSFFLPGWVAFDEQYHLLTDNLQIAKTYLDAMKRYLFVLDSAIYLAPYMVVDPEYQNKHYGILGQLVNQGRALAHYKVELICQTIKRRSAVHDLDRGLSLSIPYFNDQTLSMEVYDFDVIPRGRVMFVPAFVVLSVRAQGLKVAQETRLSRSTRRHLAKELSTLERVFLG